MRVIILLFLCGALCSVSGEFFHEPSITELRPSGHSVKDSQFGFSIAYQDGTLPRLLVGAPEQDFVGKVYSCPLSDLSTDIDCTVIDMASLKIEENTKTARENINPDQKYHFGASIAATSDYFLTCAPLMTKFIAGKIFKKRYISKSVTDVFGACFLYNASTSAYSEWMDNGVKFANTVSNKYKLTHRMKLYSAEYIVSGALGWNTLADTDNGYLLVAKSSYVGDILSVHTNNPLEVSKSLAEDHFREQKDVFNDYYNTGYGMAVGYFFSNSEKLYAVSTRGTNLSGRILFLKSDSSNNLDIMLDPSKGSFEVYYIENAVLNSMFGYALAATDINGDGLSELLVGAPAQSDDQYTREFGALHIYIGGDLLSRNDKNRMRTILGNKEDGRFGSAIATNDIDGDNIPEIFVSAPYENEYGIVYVISGYELRQSLLGHGELKQMRLTELALTQRLRGHSTVKRFGFSLQMVNDVDENGCNELAIGSPEDSSVQLFRCLPTVTANMTLELLDGPIVKESANQFTVTVCVYVVVNEKCNSFVGSISVTSYATKKTFIRNPTFVHELTKDKEQKSCKNIVVNLLTSGPEDYTFSTKLKILDVDKNGNRKDKVYKSWAVLSGQSAVESNLRVPRRCVKRECEPRLSCDVTWSGGEVIDTATSEIETLLIQVNNSGHDTNDTRVRLRVRGARLAAPSACYAARAGLQCDLPKPLKQNSSYTIRVLLNTTDPTNAVGNLTVTVQLINTMFKHITDESKHLTIPYRLDPSSVLVNGSNNILNVTDEDLEKSNIVTFSDEHEYYISNKGRVTWLNLTAVLQIQKEPFIENVTVKNVPQTVTTEVCLLQDSNDTSKWIFHCRLTLAPGAVKKIIATFEITKKSIETDISEKNLATTSKLSLLLVPTDAVLQVKSSTHLHFRKVLSVENNKGLVIAIVVAVAVLFLLLLIFVLYKYGFFKRTEKKKLDVLRESVRKRSIRQASVSSRGPKPSTSDGIHCIKEELDDCVFQEET